MEGYKFMADTLVKYGVSHVFYVESILENTLREAKSQGIKGILAHSENAAGYMADGYARASGKPGVCMAQSIGVGNLAGGIYDATLANSPVIALTGKKDPVLQYTGAYQEGEHRLLFEGITKFNPEITDAKQIPNVFRQVFREAVTGKPGPVHVDLTNNCGITMEFATIEEEVRIEETYKKYPAYRPFAEIERVKEAANEILKSQKPLLIVGRGALVSQAGKELFEFASKNDIPIVTTPDGKTIIDENDPLWAGVIGGYGMVCANIIASKVDLAILVGTQASDQTTNGWQMPKKDTKVIQIDIEPKELGRNYPNTIGLLGDAKVVLRQLIDETRETKRDAWRQEVGGHVEANLSEYAKMQDSQSSVITPSRLCKEITNVLPDDVILVSDTGNSAIWTSTMVRMRPTQKYLRAAGSLGWSFPASLGVKCAQPERPVVCFCGDGAFYYHMSEMETAVRYGINTVTIINNNRGFIQVRELLDIVFKDDPIELKEEGYRFYGINLSKVAEAMGCWSTRVEKAEDIGPAIKMALKAGRPAVVEVITNDEYTPNPMPEGPRPLYGFADARPKI
jgi:acetolactate synthase-1/2/3 large subunit